MSNTSEKLKKKLKNLYYKGSVAENEKGYYYLSCACELDPRFLPAWLERASFGLPSNLNKWRVSEVSTALQIKPNSSFLLQVRGDYLREMDRSELAFQDFDKNIRLNLTKPSAMNINKRGSI